MGFYLIEQTLPAGAVARTGAAGETFHHDGRLADGAESANVSLPIIDMVGHGDGVVCAGILTGVTAILVLRAAPLLSFVDIVSAPIAVNGANKGAAMMAKITDVPLQARIWCPSISARRVVTAAYETVIVAYVSD